MKLENTGLENVKADLNRLDEAMEEQGFVREGTWDYDRLTYDKKFEMKEGVFYLRVQGNAVEGDIGAHKAVIQLMTPLLGKYYFPHGVEYGEGENFPSSLVSQCQKILSDLQKTIVNFAL
ncbi:YugN family protein [Neobacillus sp. LXY-4]|uniref:YugN family protein n=1 Tax=Neobacillus sp. LXY-4 TaxID=3379826 RepID=UPI003EE2B674